MFISKSRLWVVLNMQNGTGSTHNIKRELRKEYRGLRRSITQQEDIGEKLLRNCLSALSFKAEDKVAGYIPKDGEIDVLPLMRHCRECYLQVLVPVVTEGSRLLKFVRWIPESSDDQQHDASCTPNIFFVPIVAFDKKLNRLGFGGGFYDYTIEIFRRERECKFIGVAHELQRCENIPVDAHDQKLDLIVTEQTVYY